MRERYAPMFGCERRYRLNRLRKIRLLRDRINKEQNVGLAKTLLFECQYTSEITITSGGWRKTTVDIQMDDGWEKTVSSLHTIDAIKEANQVIYKRLSETMRKDSKSKTYKGESL